MWMGRVEREWGGNDGGFRFGLFALLRCVECLYVGYAFLFFCGRLTWVADASAQNEHLLSRETVLYAACTFESRN